MDGGVGQKGGKEMGGMKFGCGFWRKGALTLLVVFFFFFFFFGLVVVYGVPLEVLFGCESR